ncbi:MAG: DUF2934 domain-containing protein [Candidatus Omnitrophota bacterium]
MSLKDSNTTRNKLRRAKSLLPQKETTRVASPRRAAAPRTAAAAPAPERPKTEMTNEADIVDTFNTADSSDTLQQRIAEKAYELFQLRGYNHGLDKYDWELADKLVRLELEKEQSSSRKRFDLDLEDEETQQLIAQKAYELYEQKGYVQGTNEYDWHIATELIKLEGK